MGKLKILLRHWIEHNEGHSKEFREWAQKADGFGEEKVRDSILMAVEELDKASVSLTRALGELTGDDN